MLRCQRLRFDQELARLSLSYQFPLEVFGFRDTLDTNATQISPTPQARMVTSLLFCNVGLKLYSHSGTDAVISPRNS